MFDKNEQQFLKILRKKMNITSDIKLNQPSNLRNLLSEVGLFFDKNFFLSKELCFTCKKN